MRGRLTADDCSERALLFDGDDMATAGIIQQAASEQASKAKLRWREEVGCLGAETKGGREVE